MLKVKAELRRSSVYGHGLFAVELIPKDTVIWEYNPLTCQVFTDAEYNELGALTQQLVRYFGSHSGGQWLLDTTDAKFMNHSDKPNVTTGPGTAPMVAARDIKPGEELLCNYDQFHDTKWRK